MKRTVLSICTMVLSIAGAMSQNQNPPCIVLADTDGTLPDTVVDLKNKIPMTTVGQSTYEAKGVDIEHGFAFMGESSAGSETFSFYTMPEWAVTPALVSFSNPLCVSMKRDEVIDVTPGTYDVTFVGRDATGDGYHNNTVVFPTQPLLLNLDIAFIISSYYVNRLFFTFHQLFQFLFAGKNSQIFACKYLTVILWQSHFYYCIILIFTQQNTYSRIFIF